MVALGALAFAAPWMLLGLVALPVIWWLLRVTPPSPRCVAFPPVRILRSLRAEEETPARTPLWLTLLRMLLAALAVLALAEPVLNPRDALVGDGPVAIVVDNGWAAASGWQDRQRALADLLDRAERDGRPVLLLPTAPAADGSAVAASGVLPPARARRLALTLAPMPWPTDRTAALAALRNAGLPEGTAAYWLSDGLDDGAGARLAEALADLGSLTLLQPGPGADPLALTPPDGGTDFTVTVLRADTRAERTVWVRVSAPGGRLLARAPAEFAAGAGRALVRLDLPSEARNEAERAAVEGVETAGAVVLLDERWRRRPVGLVSGAGVEERAQPLLSGLYYLQRALGPYAEIRQGEVRDLLTRPLAVLILADIGRLPDDQVAALRAWVEDGGLLLRFAGPHLAENADDLLPVRLRQGGRVLGGALSWSEPARLAPFDQSSPFHGLTVPADVLVRQQVLAQPSLDLDSRTWARLADGTPLVTGTQLGRGHLVLFHTTANANWSNLPLSGLFVDMLQRLVGLSRGVSGDQERGLLPPLLALDGLGRLGVPAAGAQPVDAAAIVETAASPASPPGFYGSEQSRRALNLAQGWEALQPLAALPVPYASAGYAVDRETALKPWLLTAAVVLALVDLLAMLLLRGLISPRLRRGAAAGLGLLLLAGLNADPATAQSRDDFGLAATSQTRLAYVRTGDRELDATSRAGLFGLSEMLTQRTSVEPGEPMAVDIERDELAFFPLIYWPVSASQPTLSDAAIAKISSFMRTGGTILFDTRDARMAPRGPARTLAPSSAAADRLRRLLRRLDIPPLAPVPQDHVLTKAFYLMQTFPGRHASGAVWVEQRGGRGNDGVSPIIIGGNDWAAAWAVDAGGRPTHAVIPGGERQREMAYRFGVNLVMYTLTGNYKADQVHVPAILERLGQ